MGLLNSINSQKFPKGLTIRNEVIYGALSGLQRGIELRNIFICDSHLLTLQSFQFFCSGVVVNRLVINFILSSSQFIQIEMIGMKKINGLKEVASLYKNYFFDLDGVLWKGQQAVPGSFEILNYLREQNKNLYFITNSSVRGREELIKKFSKYGFKAELSECFPSAYISVLYLKQRYPKIHKIMTFGTSNMANQFEIHGFEVKNIKELPHFKAPIDIQGHLDMTIDAIVVGWDPEMTFSKQCLIGFHVQNGVKLFGTNPDKYTMIGSYKVPGAGSIIAAIETGFNTKAQIIGKPNTFIIDHIIHSQKLNKEECIMIGDNRETDILFGNDAGISTLCVLSGVTVLEELEDQAKLKEKAIPKYYSKNIYE